MHMGEDSTEANSVSHQHLNAVHMCMYCILSNVLSTTVRHILLNYIYNHSVKCTVFANTSIYKACSVL